MGKKEKPSTQKGKAKPPLRIRAHGLTDIGQVRQINQDYVAVDVSRGVYVVADGMGGHAAGDEASSTAVETILHFLGENGRLPEDETFLAETAPPTAGREPEANTSTSRLERMAQHITVTILEALESANREIIQKAQTHTDLEGMGTTAIVAVHRDAALFFGHIGDSRAYILRGNTFQQLTEDHSVVAQLVAAGAITPAEARIHPFRNVITRCLGMYAEIQPDTFYILLERGDRVLLCTDGLSGVVPDPEIARVIYEESNLEKACQTLVSLANQRGGVDNITALLLYCD